MTRPSRSVSSGEDSNRRQAGRAPRAAARDEGLIRCSAVDRLERMGDLFKEVPGDHAGTSEALSGEIACGTMEKRGGTGRLPRWNPHPSLKRRRHLPPRNLPQ